MEEKKHSFESFAPGFLSLLDETGYGELAENVRNMDGFQPSGSVRDRISELENERDLLMDEDIFFCALTSDAADLAHYLEQYLKAAEECYCYFEFKYSGFGDDIEYLYGFSPAQLHLCWKYFQSARARKKADTAYFYLICKLAWDDFCWAEWLPALEANFGIVKKFIFADWLAVHPKVTWNIGRYYKERNEYEKAAGFFRLGAELDYEGRQSLRPFNEVGKNKYELGLLYFEGLGVGQSYGTALHWFEGAASDAGEYSLPIIGDMYLKGQGVEPDAGLALECYCGYNPYNLDKGLYYKELTETQKRTLRELLETHFRENPPRTFGELGSIGRIFSERLGDEDRAAELEARKEELALSTPLEDRDEEMDEFCVYRELNRLQEKVARPETATGGIPEDLKAGDVFTFGCYQGEPIEWKTLEVTEEGIARVLSTKILGKIDFCEAVEWLNTDFLTDSFTEEQQARIVPQDCPKIRKKGPVWLRLPGAEALETAEGTYPPGTVGQTAFARSLSVRDTVHCADGTYVLPDGRHINVLSCRSPIRGVRAVAEFRIPAHEKRES